MSEVRIPDIGDFADVEVIEVLVQPGDQISIETPLLTLESDKATMEIPAPYAGVVKKIHVAVGDRVSQGMLVLDLDRSTEASDTTAPSSTTVDDSPPGSPAESGDTVAKTSEQNKAPVTDVARPSPRPPPEREPKPDSVPHASPGIRRFARELGANLHQITGSGPKGRILKDDVKAWTRQQLTIATKQQVSTGTGIPALPEIDFSEFGEIEKLPLSRIKKLSGPHLHRAWLNVPHVTHHDEADITNLEEFRKSLKQEALSEGIRITILSFVMKVLVGALKKYPIFNASLAPGDQELILKKYFNIGIAVDTPNGLVVPVVKAVDSKSIFKLALDLADVSERARNGKLRPDDLKGGCISISSLGGIGGTGFTPIVNAPEVAILGISKAKMSPQWDGESFRPRLMLPIDLSYDHRVIDGAQAARFCAHLTQSFSDVRRLAL